MSSGSTGPSPTAYGAAVHRAIHQDLEGGLILADPLAWPILGVSQDEREQMVARARDQDRPTLRTFIAMRHRFADEVVAQGILRGVDQVVLLGSGLDTFAYRTLRPDVKIFEVDRPEVIGWKRQALDRAGIPIPDQVYLVQADLVGDDWLLSLAEAGMVRRPTTVLWLGVVPYLDPVTVRAMLASLATIPGVEVVFDYPTRGPGVDAESVTLRDRLGNRVAALGEPFRSVWEPAELHGLLREFGFDEIEDLGAEELADRYLRRDSLRRAGGGAGRLVRARSTRWGNG